MIFLIYLIILIYLIFFLSKGATRVPVSIMWDKNDPRFFIVQTSYYNTGQKQEGEQIKKQDDSALMPNAELKFNEEWKGYDINTFFCTSETGIKRQDHFRVESDFEGLFGKFLFYLNIMKIYN